MKRAAHYDGPLVYLSFPIIYSVVMAHSSERGSLPAHKTPLLESSWIIWPRPKTERSYGKLLQPGGDRQSLWGSHYAPVADDRRAACLKLKTGIYQKQPRDGSTSTIFLLPHYLWDNFDALAGNNLADLPKDLPNLRGAFHVICQFFPRHSQQQPSASLRVK